MPCDFVVKNASKMLLNCFRINSWPKIFDRDDNCIAIVERLFSPATPDLDPLCYPLSSIAFWTKLEMTCCSCLL